MHNEQNKNKLLNYDERRSMMKLSGKYRGKSRRHGVYPRTQDKTQGEFPDMYACTIQLSSLMNRHSLTHEPSYLPFLFPSLLHVGHSSDDGAEPVASTSNTKVNGRRTFKKGQEVTTSVSSDT